MTPAILWLILILPGLALAVSVATYIAVIRRRTEEIQLLVESLSREAAEHRKSDERYRLLVENAPDAIVSLDREGRFTSLNPFCEKLTGWPREEWIGRPFLPLVHAEDLPAVKESFAYALIGMKTPMAEIRVLSKAGDFVWMEFIMTPEFQGRKVKGVLAIGRDISARHKAERAQAAKDVEHAGSERKLSPMPLGGGEHILFIDDEPSLVKCGQRMLQQLGYRVTAVQSAGAALDLIRGGSYDFDCILTDLDMPETTGIALARECSDLLPATPILLMSGYQGVTTPDLLRSHGIHDLILKPLTPLALAEAVRRAITGDRHTNSSN
jgi:PAS domain S-box-containing protein